MSDIYTEGRRQYSGLIETVSKNIAGWRLCTLIVPALKRLEQLCAENPPAPKQIEIIREVITETVNLVVYIARHPKTGQRGPP